MKEFWDDRYRQVEYAYGEEPNTYFKNEIGKFPPASLLCPAEGEGRNAIYAALLGWRVVAFDISKEGKIKADNLAKKHQTSIDYRVGNLSELNFDNQLFDAIALIYAHFPGNLRNSYHHFFKNHLKKNGVIILEACSKKHLDYNSKNESIGGPKNIELLYSIDEIKNDFNDFKIINLEETEMNLNEGIYHRGIGHVVRFTGIKS